MANNAKDVVAKAMSYKGTTSGAEFVRHYNDRTKIGLPQDCAWCACFVSDVMRMNDVPQESVKDYKGCTTGVEWFESQGRFKSRQSGYIPKLGDVIFYEWNPQNEGTSRDDGADHTGIVRYSENGMVYTIEGNSGSQGICDVWCYPLTYSCIEGYGVPLYNIESSTPAEPPADTDFKSYSVKVTPNIGVNIRKGPSTSHDVINAVVKGTVLEITDEVNDWGEVSTGGWVYLENTKKLDAEANDFAPYTAEVTATNGLNYRIGPGKSYDCLGAYPKGTRIKVAKHQGDWAMTDRYVWVCRDWINKV